MTPEEWSFVKDVFETLRPLSPRERETYWSDSCPSLAIRAEVESLLEVYESDSEFLETPALAMGSPEFTDVLHASDISCYEIVRQIGDGGMSTVYEAYRSHRDFRQHVAIKVLKLGMDTTALLLRFRLERQILADFQHSHIAQLLDGGAMPDGRPFLVMEFIDGVPITEFCDSQKLSVPQRLRLFLQVCSAVQAAHRNLIVHRDIKPSNILVTPQGECKLLDFGIAKILEPDRYERTLARTVAAERLFTPDYASPEQIRGETITTSTDVYSLGVLLYEILAGQTPYRFESLQPDAIARQIETQEVLPPSAIVSRADRHPNAVASARSTTAAKLRRSIQGDLDKIVLRALRREPDRRYQSVEQLAEDVRRHQQGLPVTARRETVGYLARKFLSRNKAVSLVGVLLFLAILTGTAAALWQAHRAEIERQRAEQHFTSLRSLANSLIFEIHDSIKDLPGSTPARKVIVDRALKYLDSLSSDSPKDTSLQRELPGAYQRLAMVQGDTRAASLGDVAGGLATMRKAVAIWERLAESNPDNVDDRLNVAYGRRMLGNFYAAAGTPGVDKQIAAALSVAEPLARSAPLNPRVHRELEREYITFADVQSQGGNLNTALEYMQKASSSMQQALSVTPGDPDLRHSFAVVETKIGDLLEQLGRRQEALNHVRRSLGIYESLAADPTHASARREMAVVLYKNGEILMANGDPSAALENFGRGVTLVEPLATADPQNELFHDDLSGFHIERGYALIAAGKVSDGLIELTRQTARLEREVDRSPPSQWACQVLAADQIWQGDAMTLLKEFHRSLELYRQGVVTYAKCTPSSRDAYGVDLHAVSHLKLGFALAQLHENEAAFDEYQQALALAPASTAEATPQALYTAAQAYAGLGDLEFTRFRTGSASSLTHLTRARNFYQASRDAWNRIRNPAAITPSGFLCGRPNHALRRLAQCETALRRLH